MHKGSGAVIAETEYGVSDAGRGLAKLDLREQELKDMEVARKIQEEEMKVRRGGGGGGRNSRTGRTSLGLAVTHFTLCPGGAECNFCGRLFSGEQRASARGPGGPG